ncbi:uncharacterized protein LOC118739745 [Rhagoletis pomonella]|uniref:uncharacterized protein LOC118739745 n=1 Tax=Rhagoletis pomonella TaxID=28610 RepID=UPI00178768B9|nr:uncharacterized protein LOC118739745 [Rhagoletis pomonella]
MFRQIWVSPIHQDYQRIVWRESPDEPIKHYWLSTVTYGTASAPFLSVRVLQQLAMANINKFPHAANIICNNIYVDDVMAGGNSIDAVINLKTELVNLLESGGFHLRKWSSNSTAVLQTVPAEDCEAFSKHKNGGSDYIKILGLYWNPKPDKYSFHVGTPTVINATKRHILSEIARIFDIFGFLAPVVVKIKILFQEIWLRNVSWDDPLPDSSTWRHIRETLHLLEAIYSKKHFESCNAIRTSLFL